LENCHDHPSKIASYDHLKIIDFKDVIEVYDHLSNFSKDVDMCKFAIVKTVYPFSKTFCKPRKMEKKTISWDDDSLSYNNQINTSDIGYH